MEQHIEILRTYEAGPVQLGSDCQNAHNAHKRVRRSKLESEAKVILELWAGGRSLQFICDRLRTKSIFCHRSSVLRFIHKSTSL